MREPIPIVFRFWQKVDPAGPVHPELGNCWLWTGTRPGGLYGLIYVKSRADGSKVIKGAHVVSYEINIGPVPDDMCVLHHCDNPPCVRPSHLFLGTDQDNVTDMIAKGRGDFSRRPGAAKLTEEMVKELRRVRETEGLTKFGIGKSQAHNIITRAQWKGI